jgi:hypothetical protein
VLVTLRAEFGASFTTLGTVATPSSILYGLGALPAGLLVALVRRPRSWPAVRLLLARRSESTGRASAA